MYLSTYRNIIVVGALIIIVASILYKNELETLYKNIKIMFTDSRSVNKKLFTAYELSQYNGIQKDKIYLAFIGIIFDVTRGKKHYKKGGSYYYFTGKDGSRAFITGNFNDESSEKDHILDLSCDELSTILNWKNTLSKKYKRVGFLIGRYYDSNANETEYSKQFKNRLNQCQIDKENEQREQLKYPPCNIEWSVDTGSRVWCSKSSGGVVRNWEGVPRQMYTPGEQIPRCVCINLNKENPLNILKEYNNCSPTSTSCIVAEGS